MPRQEKKKETKEKKHGDKKRPLTSPELTDSQPEKRTVINDNSIPTNTSTDFTGIYSMASPGFVQPLNMANMSNMANYQTPVGTFFSPPPNTVPYFNQGSNLSQQSNTNFQQAILDRLDSMDKRLGKLDSIEQQLTKVTQKLSNLESRITVLESSSQDLDKRVGDVEASRAVDSQTCDDILSKQDNIGKQLNEERKKLQKLAVEFESLSKSNDSMKEEMVDLQSRSMRDNLLFFGFSEPATFDERRSEDCARKILNFCAETLKIENAHSEIKIERAHRVGKYVSQKSRPIVVKFNHYPDKTKIKSKAFTELKDSNYRVSEQFPKAIQDRRKQLIPVMVKAKQDGKNAHLSYDKLIINGSTFTVENVHTAGYS